MSVIKKFYIVNTDYQIKWNLINMYLGNDNTDNGYDDDIREGEEQEDRPYSKEEIQKCSWLLERSE